MEANEVGKAALESLNWKYDKIIHFTNTFFYNLLLSVEGPVVIYRHLCVLSMKYFCLPPKTSWKSMERRHQTPLTHLYWAGLPHRRWDFTVLSVSLMLQHIEPKSPPEFPDGRSTLKLCKGGRSPDWKSWVSWSQRGCQHLSLQLDLF